MHVVHDPPGARSAVHTMVPSEAVGSGPHARTRRRCAQRPPSGSRTSRSPNSVPTTCVRPSSRSWPAFTANNPWKSASTASWTVIDAGGSELWLRTSRSSRMPRPTCRRCTTTIGASTDPATGTRPTKVAEERAVGHDRERLDGPSVDLHHPPRQHPGVEHEQTLRGAAGHVARTTAEHERGAIDERHRVVSGDVGAVGIQHPWRNLTWAAWCHPPPEAPAGGTAERPCSRNVGRLRMSTMAPSHPPAPEADHCPVTSCPSCAGADFRAARSSRGVAFRCNGCGSLWRFELGYLSLVRDVA